MFGIDVISYDAISVVAYGVTFIISSVLGIVTAIEAWLIGIFLNINAGALQMTFVQKGFSITLSIANLAFVLGIIVIAIATILRNESYGIKKLLWKLVVAAILVNFGLVIMAPIYGFGNDLTQYFLNCINPGAGGCTQSASGLSSYVAFGQTFANAFNPSSPFTAPNNVSSAHINALSKSGLSGAFAVGAAGAGTTVGKMLIPIFGVVFVVIDLLLIDVVLLAFILLLCIRYLYIVILAVLMPFAWASWIFPGFSSHFEKWWSNFIRWTFFAPIVMFFIYLAMLTMSAGDAGITNVLLYTQGGSNAVWNAINSFLTPAIAPVITSFLQEILLIGLIIGGMIAANSMGIKMAGTMVSAAKAQTKKAGTWALKRGWEKTKSGATARFRRPETRSRALELQQPGHSLYDRWKGRAQQSLAVAGGEKMLDSAKDRSKGETAEQNVTRISTANGPERVARVERAIADKQVDPKKMSEREINDYFGKDQENLFKQYGERGQKIYKEAREKSGLEERDLNDESERLKKENTTLEKQAHKIIGGGKVEAGISSTQDSPEMDTVVNKINENNKKIKENGEKQSALRIKRISEDPEAEAEKFQTEEERKKEYAKAEKRSKDGGRPLPASVTLSQKSIEEMQNGIIRSMAEGFSPHTASALINALSKKNNLKEFAQAVNKMKKENPEQFKGVKDSLLKNDDLIRWFERNSPIALINHRTLFDLNEDEIPEGARRQSRDKQKS